MEEDFIGYMPYFANRINADNQRVKLANDLIDIYNDTVCHIPKSLQKKYYKEMRLISDKIISDTILFGKPFILKEKPKRCV
jgi:hypothetical protein